MSRLEAIRDWACQYSGFDGLMKINALVVKDGGAEINATSVETVNAVYIDGSEERTVEVTIRVAVPWSAGYDTFNPAAAELMEGWADWVAAQWPENPPVLDGATVTGISPAQVLPQLESVYESAKAAVYTLVIDVSFRTERGA